MPYRSIVPSILTLLIALGSSSAPGQTTSPPATADTATRTVGEGAVDMFNGKDLTGWVVEGTANFDGATGKEPVWSVRDGLIHCAGKGFGFLRYDQEVSDFEYQLEYRQAKRCNSGVGIRSAKFDGSAASRPSYSGYEIQLIDDGAKKPGKHNTGALYRYVAAKSLAAKPAGEWNQITIECRGPRIKITLNGVVVQDIDQTTVAEIAKKPLQGYLSVQNHGGEVDFRNLRLKKLN